MEFRIVAAKGTDTTEEIKCPACERWIRVQHLGDNMTIRNHKVDGVKCTAVDGKIYWQTDWGKDLQKAAHEYIVARHGKEYSDSLVS